jgi:hypothetical protein
VGAACTSTTLQRGSQLTKARRSEFFGRYQEDFWERGKAEEIIRHTSSSLYM